MYILPMHSIHSILQINLEHSKLYALIDPIPPHASPNEIRQDNSSEQSPHSITQNSQLNQYLLNQVTRRTISISLGSLSHKCNSAKLTHAISKSPSLLPRPVRFVRRGTLAALRLRRPMALCVTSFSSFGFTSCLMALCWHVVARISRILVRDWESRRWRKFEVSSMELLGEGIC